MKRLTSQWLVFLGIVAFVAGCGSGGTGSEANIADGGSVDRPQREQNLPKVVFTTFYPTTYFCQRIGGDEIEVRCPLPPGEDPIFWRPTPEDLDGYRAAGLIVINGADYEKWVKRVALPLTRVVNTAAALQERFITFETVTHSHGSGGEHTHEGIDGHTWLDPMNAIVQAEEIKRAFSDAWPDLASYFEANFETLQAQLEFIHRRLEIASTVMNERQILCSHPAYNYLAARYGWPIDNLDLDPETPLSEEQIQELREKIDADRKRIMLWEAEPLEETAQFLEEELGIINVVFMPAENLPEGGITITVAQPPGPGGTGQTGGTGEREGNYFSIMNQNILNLNAALRR